MLYKYYHPDSIDYVFLREGVSLRASQPSSLNDPFELNFSVTNLVEKVLSEKRIDPEEINNEKFMELISEHNALKSSLYSEIFFDLSEATRDKSIGIISMSRKKKSRTMWSYYADSNKGFMIAFKSKRVGPVKSIKDIDFKNVQYSKERPSLKNIRGDDNNYYTKDIAWKHELESRAIIELKNHQATKTDSNGYPVHTVIIDPADIYYVVLGVRASKSLERKIKFWIEEYAPTVHLFKAKPKAMTYDLIHEPILTLPNRHTSDTPSS